MPLNMVVDKWFVEKGFGSGKVKTGDTIASSVQGREVFMVGVDAWTQVVSDDARAGRRGTEQEQRGHERRGRRTRKKRRRGKKCSKCDEQRHRRQSGSAKQGDRGV